MDRKNPKIAFCFLTYGNLSQSQLWNNFFPDKKNKYNIYLHNKENFVDKEYHFERNKISKIIKTKWADISLVRATLLLFKYAYFDDSDNQFFILLSDTCVPLYDFDYIYDKIITKNNSFIGQITNKKIFFKREISSLKKPYFFDINSYTKQHQWIILTRKTLLFFILNDYTNIFTGSFVPDEHYFINICNKYKISYINQCSTFVNWKEKSNNNIYRPYPKTYDTLTMEQIEKIRKTPCLFMRKISKSCQIPEELENEIKYKK